MDISPASFRQAYSRPVNVGVEGLAELVRICRPGGAIVLTVKKHIVGSGFLDASG